MEFQCDSNCPTHISKQFCCKNCKNSKKEYITETNNHLWSDEYGFWAPKGCALGREKMPLECKDFDSMQGEGSMELDDFHFNG